MYGGGGVGEVETETKAGTDRKKMADKTSLCNSVS